MRKLEVLYVLIAVFLFGCASAPTQRVPNEQRVASHAIVYTVDDLVASGYAHAGTFNLSQVPPFYVLVSDRGFSCVVPASTYTLASDGSLFACSWRARRGGI